MNLYLIMLWNCMILTSSTSTNLGFVLGGVFSKSSSLLCLWFVWNKLHKQEPLDSYYSAIKVHKRELKTSIIQKCKSKIVMKIHKFKEYSYIPLDSYSSAINCSDSDCIFSSSLSTKSIGSVTVTLGKLICRSRELRRGYGIWPAKIPK